MFLFSGNDVIGFWWSGAVSMNSNVVAFTIFETLHPVDVIAMLQAMVKLLFS